MATDASWIGQAMGQRVPWVRSMGLEFGEVTPERAVVRLPDDADMHNHVGGPHAAMIFGLGETASGAITMVAFGGLLDRATPLVVGSEVRYLRPARGPLTATAVLERPSADVLAELDAGTRPEFTVSVVVTDAGGRETTHLSVVWTLRPNRPATHSSSP